MIDEEETDSPSRGSFWRELPILLAVAVVVAFVVRAFLLQTFFIPSPSMQHTLNVNDRVLVNKLVYDFRDPHRGEIIVFNAPDTWRTGSSEKDFIKRVIAVGGDNVMCCDAQQRLVVNGRPLDETYLDHDQPGPASPDPFNVTVPKGRLWVMGDNRFHSGDSREQFINTNGDVIASTISVKAVVGRAIIRFWPLSRLSWLGVPDTYESVPSPNGD